jgi:hypothetical protein
MMPLLTAAAYRGMREDSTSSETTTTISEKPNYEPSIQEMKEKRYMRTHEFHEGKDPYRYSDEEVDRVMRYINFYKEQLINAGKVKPLMDLMLKSFDRAKNPFDVLKDKNTVPNWELDKLANDLYSLYRKHVPIQKGGKNRLYEESEYESTLWR